MVDLAYAMGAPGAEGQSGGPYAGLLMILIIFGIFYFLLIRPQMKRQKQHQAMVSSLRKGDKVITTGGIHGTVVGVKEDVATLKIADQVKIEVSKSCVASIKERGE
ncbi:MAG: preprotein translocase subunit YajC [Candidatus Eiseniibacteriota bacterium]|nr:MAG: preprotein translocase subunit YajC [Candidatus Eisenbacteria bacterium]